jgi:hypothetical protein
LEGFSDSLGDQAFVVTAGNKAIASRAGNAAFGGPGLVA